MTAQTPVKQLPADTPVRFLKGVGPKISEKLEKIGIRTLEDLVYYYPRAWEDRTALPSIRHAQLNQEMTFRGVIADVSFQTTRRGFAIANVLLRDATGELPCKWMRRFSYRYDVLEPLRRELQPGLELIAHGKINLDFSGKWMAVDEHEVLSGSPEDLVHVNRIVPIYAATEGLKPRFIRRLVHDALEAADVRDPVPPGVQPPEALPDLQWALHHIHFPDSQENLERARRRLAFQELFMIQTVLAIVRKKRRVRRSAKYEIKRNLLTPFRNRIGFDFTPPQKKVINEIFKDLTSDTPMNRLLQGDVGSGKTVVAVSAMLLACENNLQAVLMAPTEILAEQHAITLRHLLHGLPVNVGLLTGSVKGAARKQFFAACASGEIQIAIGTHALLESEVQFKDCALVVIDEQHRFGVKHRLDLTRRKPVPDVLVMTATPIPRTLALSLYGDLDVSTIDSPPPGRQKIRTIQRNEDEALQILAAELAGGGQAYVVYPLVDESDKTDLKSAMREFERMKSRFPRASVGLLHGQMSGAEKERAMLDFKSGATSILVATTVIEVGIDVPNASLMVIQHAERFGLATLHQLRGRVGRGSRASTCVVVAQPATDDARRRLEVFLETTDGFRLAQEDLQIRGPGEIFGTSQHGMPPLKIADFMRDQQLMAETQQIARDWVEQEPDLSRPEFALLQAYLRKHFGKSWHWATIA